MPFGRAFAVAPDRQHWPEIKVEVDYFVWPWEFHAYLNDKVPKRIQLILERRLRKRYIDRHPEEFSEVMQAYDEIDQSDDSLCGLSRLDEKPAKSISGSYFWLPAIRDCPDLRYWFQPQGTGVGRLDGGPNKGNAKNNQRSGGYGSGGADAAVSLVGDPSLVDGRSPQGGHHSP